MNHKKKLNLKIVSTANLNATVKLVGKEVYIWKSLSSLNFSEELFFFFQLKINFVATSL